MVPGAKLHTPVPEFRSPMGALTTGARSLGKLRLFSEGSPSAAFARDDISETFAFSPTSVDCTNNFGLPILQHDLHVVADHCKHDVKIFRSHMYQHVARPHSLLSCKDPIFVRTLTLKNH